MKPNKKRLTCIICPISCVIDTEYNSRGIKSIKGHQCKKGELYAKEELFNPTRILTTTIKVYGGVLPLVSVKTDKPIPKDKIFSVMAEVMRVTLHAPVKLGDIIIKNVLDTKANIVATKTVERFHG